MARTILVRDAHGEYRVTIAEGFAAVDGADPIPVAVGGDGRVLVGLHPRRAAWVRAAGDVRWVFFDGQTHTFEVPKPGARRRTGGHHGTLSAPMPATVVRLQAEAGRQVARGDVLIVLEAMKMELPIRAPYDGVISAIHCRPGELVQPGVGLIEIDEISA